MCKPTIVVTAVGALFAGATATHAHHGYSQYDRCKQVPLEGTVESVAWENPHVVVMLETSDDGLYRLEWQSLTQLGRADVDRVIAPGDRLIVTGSINKNPATKVMTLLREIRRPSDGWSWRDTRPIAAQCGN